MSKLVLCSRLRSIVLCTKRQFTTNGPVMGKKSREPFDKRFPVSGRHLSPRVKGGSQETAKRLGVHIVQRAGVQDNRIQKFRVVPEMVPEFIVPDLTDFKLKPYVSYKVPDVTQSQMTAQNLFDICYGQKLVDRHKEGKLTDQEVEKILQAESTKKLSSGNS